MFDEQSARRISKVVKLIETNPDAITPYLQSGNNTTIRQDSNLPLHVFLLTPSQAAILYETQVYWYRFTLNSLLTPFTIPLQAQGTPTYVVASVQLLLNGEASDWIEIPERLQADTNRSYFFRFMTALLGGIKTLPSYQENAFQIEYTTPDTDAQWPLAQFTFGRPIRQQSSDTLPLPPERQVEQLIISKVKFRRRKQGVNGTYYYDGPPTNPMFINPFYFTRANYYFDPSSTSNSHIQITILAQPNFAQYFNSFDTFLNTEALAFPTANRGYVILNVARNLFYPLQEVPYALQAISFAGESGSSIG